MAGVPRDRARGSRRPARQDSGRTPAPDRLPATAWSRRQPTLPMPQPWQRPGFMASIRRFAEPRLMMTAAMAFFSIALTLNLTGVRLSSLRLSRLCGPRRFVPSWSGESPWPRRPSFAITITFALFTKSKSRMRELRRATPGREHRNSSRKTTQPAAPGESKQNPPHKDGGSRVDPPQQSGVPADNDSHRITLENLSHTSWTATRPLPSDGPVAGLRASGGSDSNVRERSTVWTA